MPAIFAILTILGAIGLTLHVIMQYLLRRLVFWSSGNEDRIAEGA